MENIRVGVVLDKEALTRLQNLAKATERSASAMLRVILAEGGESYAGLLKRNAELDKDLEEAYEYIDVLEERQLRFLENASIPKKTPPKSR